MIFVTVGTQLPFDRLVRAIDDWAGRNGRSDVIAQIGESDYKPRHIDYQPHVTPRQFSQHVAGAECIVSHAGMGTILSALGTGKPLVVMPRRAELGEHRNDHQLATARRIRELGRIMVAMDDAELLKLLDGFRAFEPGQRIPPHASESLQARVRAFITGSKG